MPFLKDRNDAGLMVGGMLLLSAALIAVVPALWPPAKGASLANIPFTQTYVQPPLTTYEQAAAAGTVHLAHATYSGEEMPITRPAAEVPKPVGSRPAEVVKLELETIERMGKLADGTTYRYWTFGGQVPGPFLRVRVGDIVEVTLKNHDDSTMSHNVDFHAVTGPGGGGVATTADPGQSAGLRTVTVDSPVTVGQLVLEKIAVLKENIVVRRFVRFRLGEASAAPAATGAEPAQS